MKNVSEGNISENVSYIVQRKFLCPKPQPNSYVLQTEGENIVFWEKDKFRLVLMAPS